MIIGILAILLGILIAAAGLRLYLFLLPAWGFVVGFLLGASLVSAGLGGGFLVGALGFVAGIVLGLVFALLSYFYWYIGVVMAVGLAGFIFGSALFGALGVGPDWLLFILALAVGTVFLVFALFSNFPVFMVAMGTALSGTAVAIGGILIVFGQIDLSALSNGEVWRLLHNNLLLWVIWVVGSVAGFYAQIYISQDIALPPERWNAISQSQKPKST